MRTLSLSLLLAVVGAVSTWALEPIPDKTVVLTFDDAPKSHRSFVGPLLAELGFGATFFVTARWMDDADNFMTWQEIAELHAMGFEIGNHSWSHLDFGAPENAAHLAGQLALVENELAAVDVPKPVSFAWCGNGFGPEGLDVLQAQGYQFARRGMQPEVPYGEMTLGPVYHPAQHHPLLLPSAGDAYPNWTLEHFREVVDRARDGRIAIVQFHGVPDVAHPWVDTPPEQFRAYMDYLKSGGFHVIAMRDLARYVDPAAPPKDPMTAVHYGPKRIFLPEEVQASRTDADYWLTNMLRWHRYNPDEAAGVLQWPVDKVLAWNPRVDAGATTPRLAPYPGGRHPRIGFLDGAIDPMRGSKVSIFSPWEDGGYALLDLPEAVFSNLGLLFLAHTHVPTIWDDQHVRIENRDWQRSSEDDLENTWTLPNGVRIGAKIWPSGNGADFTLWLENGTSETLTGLRTQVCVMLKGLPGFEAQNQDNKRYAGDTATATSVNGKRAVSVTASHCGRVWGNPKVPCIHADPVLPDCAPGERSEITGQVRFEGE